MTLQIEPKDLSTIVGIPVTPFDKSGQIDAVCYSQLVNSMTKGGVTVCTPNGNTGEFYSLHGEQEWRLALDAALEGSEGGIVVPGVGFDADTAKRLCDYAVKRGAPAVMVHQPAHPFQSNAGWVAYHESIASAHPDLGIIPYVRSASVAASALVELIERCSNVVAVKYATSDLFILADAVATVGVDQIAWICGLAESWAPFQWVVGASGFTSGLVNIDPSYSFELLAALRSGDGDGTIAAWRMLRPFEMLRARHNDAINVSVIKEALAQLGRCDRSVRPPIDVLEPAERGEVRSLLVEWGLVEMSRSNAEEVGYDHL